MPGVQGGRPPAGSRVAPPPGESRVVLQGADDLHGAHCAVQLPAPLLAPPAHRVHRGRGADRHRRIHGLPDLLAVHTVTADRPRLSGGDRREHHRTRLRAGGGRGHDRRRRGQEPPAWQGPDHRLRHRASGVQAREPELRRQGLDRRFPAAPIAGVGHQNPAGRPGIRGGRVLRRARENP